MLGDLSQDRLMFSSAKRRLKWKQTVSLPILKTEVLSLAPVQHYLGYFANFDHICGVVVSVYKYHPRDSVCHSLPYPRNFDRNIGSGMGSSQHRDYNWVHRLLVRSSEIWLRKLKLRQKENVLLTTRPFALPCASNHFSRSWLFGSVESWI